MSHGAVPAVRTNKRAFRARATRDGTWVVTDGGQGGYDKIQQAQERTRGPFSKKTGIFSSSIAEAGQSKGDRRLEGWVDIDAYRAEHP